MKRVGTLARVERDTLYDEVMRYRPRHWGTPRYKITRTSLNATRVAEICGVPRGTVVFWWNGNGRPGSQRGLRKDGKCRNGHQRTAENTKVHKSGRRECLDCAALRRRPEVSGVSARDLYAMRKQQEYADRHEFHPKWNPDLALAKLESLWVPAVEVGQLMLRSYPADEIRALFDGRQGNTVVREILAGHPDRKWVRLDVADVILTALGLLPCMLKSDPIYSGGKAPC